MVHINILAVPLLALAVNALPTTASYAVKERHTVPQSWTKTGDASKSETIHLQIGLRQSNRGAIEQHLLEVSDPSHARYGQHLSAQEVNDIIAPSDESIALVESWLAEFGVQELSYAPAKDWVHIIVPIETAEELLQTKYSTFEHEDGTTISRAPEWSLPLHLHEHIDVVQPTTSFFHPKGKAVSHGPPLSGPSFPASWWKETGQHLYGGEASGANSASVAAVCNVNFTTPTCLRTLYGTIDYTPQVPGLNKISISNYLNETNKRSDVKLFLENLRPEAAGAADTFEIVIINNANNDQGNYTAAQVAAGKNREGNLDAELVLSITWPTPLTAFSTGGTPPFIPDASEGDDPHNNEPYLNFLNYVLAQDNLPQVLSTSYGDDEQTVPLSFADRVCSGYAQLGARGISVFFSSGDSGVGPDGACISNINNQTTFIPEFPTACPWVTSVGATAYFNPEVAVKRFGSGAGFSNYFGAPQYQQATVNAYIESLDGLYDGLYNKSGRGYPDVAAQGNHDATAWDNKISTVGGTSASSPTFASVISLVNDALLARGRPPLGFINPWLYSGGYKALTDITSGSSIGCDVAGFPAKVGWDAVTGFGTPNFGALVEAAFAQGGWPQGGWPQGGQPQGGWPQGGHGSGNGWGNWK